MDKDTRITINNGMFLRVNPLDGGKIAIYKENKHGALLEMATLISHGDFVTMLNWYRCQKENGNTNLEF